MASCVCGSGIVKTHQLGFQECDSLRAVFAKDLSPNHIKLQSRILGEVVGNFPNFLEEVTLLADPECVRLKNYCKEDSVDQRATMTEVCLVPAEFDDYQIGVDAAITFCLKELRAVLLFTDALPQTVSLYFESAGRSALLSPSFFHFPFSLLSPFPPLSPSPSQLYKILHSSVPIQPSRIQYRCHHRSQGRLCAGHSTRCCRSYKPYHQWHHCSL
ncbi:Cell cycle checkpoint control protein RAD9A [Geodia barretti]|uniref:Cell cycle checkpoint control protein RAD9A n=1 Tax=Geodia barretti TaxID=519541 RepID=A0AA35TBA4_GEOBA|nr:Cell cycle checkpoint control protein RAD9A [Geodia barretti]